MGRTPSRLSPFTRETRRRSDGHGDGVTVAWRRVDAIDANLKFGNVQKQTLSQHRGVLFDARDNALFFFQRARQPVIELFGTEAREASCGTFLFSPTVAEARDALEAARVRKTSFGLIAALVEETLGPSFHRAALGGELLEAC